jgi:hypothetical protein
MQLSPDAALVFVLRSGCVGRLVSGRIERNACGGLNVFSPSPRTVNEYISGANLRSWCLLGPDAKPLDGWSSIRPEDRDRILAKAAF